MKSMILYQPLDVDNKTDPNSGTLVRPKQMKAAFEDIGYKVICVSGNTKQRKMIIDYALKNSRPEFMYIESANIPMIFSNRNHLPIAPFADFRNFRKVKKVIKIGIFYRDAYWRFPTYKNEVGTLKAFLLQTLFFLEFVKLKKVMDFIFVPNIAFSKLLPDIKGKAKFYPLPGGCMEDIKTKFNENVEGIRLLYSGNLSNEEYNLEGLLKLLEELLDESIFLDINTNQNAFERCSSMWPSLNRLIAINKIKVNYSSYQEADLIPEQYNVAIIYNNIPDNIIPIYMPLKLFQYLAMGLPIIAKKGSGYGDFIEQNCVGWTFENDAGLKSLLKYLCNQNSEIKKMAENVQEIREKNTWKERAKTVEKLLR